MTEKKRRELANLCRARRKTFIVIDEALILYLCGERGSRLPVMFACSLPFTFLEPYTDTAGLVPPEMFYGRQREKDTIIDPMGSCFIYGGRQLGKTALLRDVERTFHNPRESKLALWIDLKIERIGYEYSIDNIWTLLTEKLKEYQILPQNLPPQTKEDRILEHIRNWITANPHSRILLLLDEADKFLEADGKKDFPNVSRMKGLMDQTNRRFKVVFAGLHNVQRTTKQSNHPLAHFGEPICIGPLLKNGEFIEAQSLIKKPLENLGYYFESSDPVMRILSQTNYYPSLIQLYCKHLLRHVTDTNMELFISDTYPPYKITTLHVENAYKSQELRKPIIDRFMWTLILDLRYKLIALAIAHNSISEEGDRLENSFTITQIRDEVMIWWPPCWPAGFRDSVLSESLRVLLDEMVGLGILRITGDGKYALRNPNVITLLGTKEDIENNLLEIQKEEPPLEYEPATFRSAYRVDGKVEPARRNPLTAQQEAKLKDSQYGVSIISGCEASGLLDLENFIKSALGDKFFNKPETIIDRTNFTKYLSTMDDRQKFGTTLLLITPQTPWTDCWVYDAIDKVTRLKSKNAFLHIAFVADPYIIWALLDDLEKFNSFFSKEVNIINLHPWQEPALRQWLEDCDFRVSNKEGRNKIAKVTGNWPLLIDYFYNTKSNKDLWKNKLEEIEKLFANIDFIENLFPKFGLNIPIPNKILNNWIDLGEEEISKEDLATVIEDIPVDNIERTLRWGEQLCIINSTGNNYWRIDQVVKRILEIYKKAKKL